MVETHSGAKKHAFQAEVKQVLDIVINSLYTHREIFVRELVSNAADALEKVRHETITNNEVKNPDAALEIHIDVNESGKTLTFRDTGVGMTEAEVVENLGTIAHSGTREFLKKAAEMKADGTNLIGKFGVGFYSAFMVANEIRVRTQSYIPTEPAVEWKSDGSGEYTIEAIGDDLPRGTEILIKLRDDAEEYANVERIKQIIKQYSNFVPVPILINGEKVNTVQAIWTRNKNDIKDDEYKEFYRFVANAYDDPIYRMHFSADAPIQINALLFFPEENMERFGFGKMDPGVNLYCKRVLIQQNSDAILPDWLRFVKGVVDSEDLPLNISRETFQSEAIVQKLKKVVTSRLLKFLKEQSESDTEKYIQFWKNFNHFLKEGVATDYTHKDEILPLLRFESSAEEADKFISLNDYISRLKLNQDKIYYINGPSREVIESGPYIEAFKKRGIEVLYLFEPIDDFVMNSIHEFDGKQLVSADQSDLNLPDAGKDDSDDEAKLSYDDTETLTTWMKGILGSQVETVRASKRLVDSPAVVVNADTNMTLEMQKFMKTMNQEMGAFGGKYALEFNPKHPMIKRIAERQKETPNDDFLKMAVEQLFENAKAAAGLVQDPRTMVQRNYEILQRSLEK